MITSVHYECNSNSSEEMQFNIVSDSGGEGESPSNPNKKSAASGSVSSDEPKETGKILCTHDGVLLKKASAEYIAELNTSGSLSLVEYGTVKRLYIEWRPNDNILIADDSHDQGDWALVDTISRRNRTASECKVFDAKPMESSTGSIKSRVIRSLLDDLSCIEVKQRRQAIKFIRKLDGTLHTEFFFQNGNADLFLSSLKKLHVIDLSPMARAGEAYVIFPTEAQKLKKTFAELDIGEIKASSLRNEGWLPNRFVGLLASIPDYMANRTPPRYRPCTMDTKDKQKSSPSSENYQVIALTGSTITSDSHSVGSSSLEKSPESNNENGEKIIKLPDRKTCHKGSCFNRAQWIKYKTQDGRISESNEVLRIISRGGLDESLRPEVWKYLLNYFHWDDSEVQCINRRNQKSMEYYTMKAQWLSMTAKQEANFSGFRDRKCQIEKDVKRTDRSLKYFAGDDNPNLSTLQGILMTYVMYNFDLGYVQGMSDLLAPILATMQNEVDAFWCFVGFMDMVFVNFDMDQAGMKTQFSQLRSLLEITNPRLFKYMTTHDSDNMYFCFRWLLVWFKREFSNEDILTLWEILWTKLPCANYHLIVSLAILEQQTDIIIENQYEFNDILKHVNELSGNINLSNTLGLAESIYYQLMEAENLPNRIRRIIGLSTVRTDSESESPEKIEDIDEYIKELTVEEKKRNQEDLEESCDRSMFLQYM